MKTYILKLWRVFSRQMSFFIINFVALTGAMVVIMVILSFYVWILQSVPLKCNSGELSQINTFKNDYPVSVVEPEKAALLNKTLKNSEFLITSPLLREELVVGNTKHAISVRNINWQYSEYLDVQLVAGTKFQERHFRNKRRMMLINESLAEKQGNLNDALGQMLVVRGEKYEVVGVFKDMIKRSRTETNVFIPMFEETRKKANFLQVWVKHKEGEKEELETKLNKSDSKNRYKLESEKEKLYKSFRDIIGYAIFFVGLAFLLPALLLGYLTHFRMQLQLKELGLRRAFGASRVSIYRRLIKENIVFTIVAGVFALLVGQYLVSILFYGANGCFWRFDFPAYLFVITFIAFLVFGVVTALFPARKVARNTIVNSLND